MPVTERKGRQVVSFSQGELVHRDRSTSPLAALPTAIEPTGGHPRRMELGMVPATRAQRKPFAFQRRRATPPGISRVVDDVEAALEPAVGAPSQTLPSGDVSVSDPVALRPVPPPGGVLDRAAMERVLARASELASQSSDAPDGMSEAQLLDIAKEVGIPSSLVQQALAEERTRVTLQEETGMEARVMGPAAVTATRAVSHTPEVVLAALEEWMRTEYRMLEKRRYGDRRTWEQRSGVFADLDRSLRGNQAAATLSRAAEVSVTVSAIGDGRTAVRLDADLTNLRRNRRNGSIAMGVTGVVLGTVPVVLGATLAPIAMLPLFLLFGTTPLVGMSVGGWAMAKGHRKQAERAHLAIEQLLDRLEHGPLPRSALGTGATPLLTESITAVAQGVRDVARAVQDASRRRAL